MATCVLEGRKKRSFILLDSYRGMPNLFYQTLSDFLSCFALYFAGSESWPGSHDTFEESRNKVSAAVAVASSVGPINSVLVLALRKAKLGCLHVLHVD